ncbi:VanW family protein [Candidatus Gottesmanbacteria bacterium]|nr:VanW family protein [Candidatus Gottesmanbacteria bacterium]
MRRFIKLTISFFLGAILAVFILTAGGYLIFTAYYQNKIYPGVKISNLSNLSNLSDLSISFESKAGTVSATAKELNLHFDKELMSKRAYSIGRQTKNPYYNFLQILAAWQGKIILPVEVTLDKNLLNKKLETIAPLLEKNSVDAVYQFTPEVGPDGRGRVTAFKQSQNGVAIDRELLVEEIINAVKNNKNIFVFSVPLKIIYPNIKSSTADDLGIKNLLGEGQSYFYDSIPGRIYNINLGTEKISGSLVAPGEIFSFNQAIGTVSAVFGFQKAYAIIKGKTVLDDGGGVCQVSTTLYRAVLNAGLPVIARTAHSYRVGFYEQGGFLSGLDATVYPPDPDFKFKNDTSGWILIQAGFSAENKKLTFDLFGQADGRRTTIQGPYILSTSPPPEPVYEDDPAQPAGQIKQIDTAHYGAKVYFKRQVVRGSETLIEETVYSDYIPWPARFLRGTKT